MYTSLSPSDLNPPNSPVYVNAQHTFLAPRFLAHGYTFVTLPLSSEKQ